MSRRWLEGIYLGTRFTSGEHLVSMSDGRVVKARSIQPFAKELQYRAESIDTVVGAPWDPVVTAKRGAY